MPIYKAKKSSIYSFFDDALANCLEKVFPIVFWFWQLKFSQLFVFSDEYMREKFSMRER